MTYRNPKSVGFDDWPRVVREPVPEGQFGPDDTNDGYRKHAIREGRRGPDFGSKEEMRRYEQPD